MQPSSAPSLDASRLQQVEAARYALLRRLAFAMRHEMVVHPQPIGMITEVVERRLKAAEPDLAQVKDSVAKINTYSRAAVQSCLDVITWLAPEPGRLVPLDEGVREGLSLLRSSFGFRGFTLRDELGAVPMPVPRAGLRQLLPACLLLLTDSAGPPAEVTVTVEVEPTHVALVLVLQPTEGMAPMEVEPPYRPLSADEVHALAQAEGMTLTLEGDTLRLDVPLTTAAGS